MAAEQAASTAPDMSRNQLLAALAAQCAVMVAIGLALWWWSGRRLSAFASFSPGELGFGIGLALALILSAVALWRVFPRAGERLVRLQADQYAFLVPHLTWPVIVAVSLCAGLGEEALFRAGLQTFLGDHLGAPAAIAVSSALFAVIHLGKPVVTALLFLIGCLFGVIFWWTGSFLIVAVGHAVYDVWALRYLQGELVRLDLIGAPALPLANPADAS